MQIKNQLLSGLTHYDPLTALPNRVFFNEIFNKIISHAKRNKKVFALLFIDLDHLKTINDILDQQIGDLVLKEIAQRFLTVLRSDDILARVGGDEFILLLNDIYHPKFASTIAEKIIQLCSCPINVNTHEFFITARIGICIFPEDGTSLEELIKHGDLAIHQAKHAGGGFQYFTQQMQLEEQEHIKLAAALKKAVTQHELVLYYQPKLNLKDGSIVGAEALIRWQHPELGLLTPNRFIPIAEETEVILQIDDWVLREACYANKLWQDQNYAPIGISVNLSAKQFQLPEIVQRISDVLAETGLNPEYLELEITEATIFNFANDAIKKLHALKQLGVKIVIDHFGSRYSSISHLQQFNVSTLKIDRSFINGIPNNKDNLAITMEIIAFAHRSNMTVVAQGVETAEQLQFLADYGCDMVQGYYLSRPLSAAKILLQFPKKVE